MFWLPPESGEKVSLGITVFLAFAVLMTSLSDDLPESSNSFPILGEFVTYFIPSVIPKIDDELSQLSAPSH